MRAFHNWPSENYVTTTRNVQVFYLLPLEANQYQIYIHKITVKLMQGKTA